MTITVFTDSQAAITKILDPKAKVSANAIQRLIYYNAYILKIARHTMVIQWVFGHSKVPKNKKTDTTAKDVVYKRE